MRPSQLSDAHAVTYAGCAHEECRHKKPDQTDCYRITDELFPEPDCEFQQDGERDVAVQALPIAKSRLNKTR